MIIGQEDLIIGQSKLIEVSLMSGCCSPVVFPEGDSELGAALLAAVALAPLGLRAQRVQQPEQQLLRRYLKMAKEMKRHFRSAESDG